MQFTAEKRELSYKFTSSNLTIETDRPLGWNVPGSVFKTSDIVLLHVFVNLKVEILVLAGVADIPIELDRVSVPLEGDQGFLRRSWRVDAGHPLAGVKTVV